MTVRDPVANKILDIDEGCLPRLSLVKSVVAMMNGDIIGVESSVVLGSISVKVGSNEVVGDLVAVKIDSVAFDSSIVTCFTSVVVGVKPVMDG